MYKKGIKSADAILKKFPENGETLAMKGLLMNCMDRKEEAYDLVKRGVKANLRSHVCWHVYGLLYRSDREYEEAIKCYKNALRMDADNITVLRDLAQLQVQMRDLPGFLDTRQSLLEQKPNNRQNWVGLALAHHLCGNYQVAATVIDAYDKSNPSSGNDPNAGPGESDAGSEAYERGEMLLYRVSILEEGARFDEALEALEAASAANAVKDRLGALECKGRLLLALQRWKDAESVYKKLVRINPENYAYHDGLIKSILSSDDETNEIKESSVEVLQRVYADLQATFPHGSAVFRRPLDFTSGPAFEDAVNKFVRRYIAKGIPSLFSELKPLYANAEKAAALDRIFSGIESSLSGTENVHPDAQGTASHNPKNTGPHSPRSPHSPQSLLWTRLYLAQHEDIMGNTEKAVALINHCIQHTPTLIEAYTIKSRILKHAGDLEGAAEAAETARTMDLADRYLNCTAVKALFRAGKIEDAERIVLLFSKDGEGTNALYEMQATWYEIASGRAYLAVHDYARALKRFLKVASHFEDFVEDQFDFHGYCIRKQTMRAYVDMLRFEDGLYRQPAYAKATAGAVKAYLALSDDSLEKRNRGGEGIEEERKKTEQETKKNKQKTKEKQSQKQNANANTNTNPTEKADPDPDGALLAATPQPLEEATKLIRRLEAAAPDRLSTHTLGFEVYLRKRKYFLAARSCCKAKYACKESGHPDVFYAIVRLARAVSSAAAGEQEQDTSVDGTLLEIVAGLLDVEDVSQCRSRQDLISSLEKYKDTWEATHKDVSLAHRLACAKVKVDECLADKNGSGEKMQGILMDLASCDVDLFVKKDPTTSMSKAHQQCVEVHAYLVSLGQEGLQGPGPGTAAAEEFASRCRRVFRWSRYFGGDLCMKLSPKGATSVEDAHPPDGMPELHSLKLS